MKSWCAIFLLFGMVFTGCDNEPGSEAPSQTAGASDAEGGPAGPLADGERAILAPVEVDMDVEQEEVQMVKAGILSRIDAMPGLTDAEKDTLYVQIERARGMGKMMVIRFPEAGMEIENSDGEMLAQTLTLPQFRVFTEDPAVVFIVLGFADKSGDPESTLARTRADSVISALRDRCGIENTIHGIGIKKSEPLEAGGFDKNQTVEIWAVLP